jgi:hypothetical protein
MRVFFGSRSRRSHSDPFCLRSSQDLGDSWLTVAAAAGGDIKTVL